MKYNKHINSVVRAVLIEGKAYEALSEEFRQVAVELGREEAIRWARSNKAAKTRSAVGSAYSKLTEAEKAKVAKLLNLGEAKK